MKIKLDNLRAWVTDISDESRNALIQYLTIEDRSAYFRGALTADVPLFDCRLNTFPTGLLPDVRAFLELEVGDDIEILDARTKLPGPDWGRLAGFGQELAPHQIEAIKAFEKNTRGIVRSPTSSGKGTSIAAICHLWHQCRWLVLVHRTQIARELGTRFTRLTGEEHGYVGEGQGDVRPRVVFGTYATFYRNRKKNVCKQYLASVEGLLVDECHTASAMTHYFIANSTPRAYWRGAVSGTPTDRGDGKNPLVVGAFGPIVCKIDDARLVESGFVAKCHIVLVTCRQTYQSVARKNVLVPKTEADEKQEDLWNSQIPLWAREKMKEINIDDPKAIYEKFVAFSDVRNNLILQCVLHARDNDRLPAIVFCKLLDHGKLLEKRLARLGFRVVFVSGSGATAQVSVREDAIKRLGMEGPDGLDVVVGNVVLQEGIDQERIVSIINGAGGKSAIATIQQAGRARRRGRSIVKDECWVYEIKDTGHKALERHANARVMAYKRSGYDIENLLVEDLPEIT